MTGLKCVSSLSTMKKLLRFPLILALLVIGTLLTSCVGAGVAVGTGPAAYYGDAYYGPRYRPYYGPRYYRPSRVIVRPAPVIVHPRAVNPGPRYHGSHGSGYHGSPGGGGYRGGRGGRH